MKNIFKTVLYFGGLTALFLWAGYLLGGGRGILAAFLFAALTNSLAFWWSERLVLWTHRAEPLSEHLAPEVFTLIRELCGEAGLPMPRVYFIPTASPNALATGRSPRDAALVLTQGAIEMLNREELKGILAHELAHVESGDILISTLAAAFASLLMFLASGVKGMFWLGSARDSKGGGMNPLVFLATGIFFCLAALLIRLLTSQSREYAADRRGGNWCGSPLYLAAALAKLEAGLKRFPMRQARPANSHLFVMSPLEGKLAVLFKTHPQIEERIARLEEMARGIEKGLNGEGVLADIDAAKSSS